MYSYRLIYCFIITLLLFLTGWVSVAEAQEFRTYSSQSPQQVRTSPVQKIPPIKREFNVGGMLNTNGWSGLLEYAWVDFEDKKTSDFFYRRRLLQLEVSEIKHPKEIKEVNSYLSSITNQKPSSFIYGKINTVYTVKLGYGKSRLIAGKPEPGNVSIHWNYLGGISVALLKPYYIYSFIRTGQDSSAAYKLESLKYSEETHDDYLMNKPLILGRDEWTKGFNEMSVIPGIYLKSGLHFDFSRNRHMKFAAEIGFAAEIYVRRIEIMALQKHYPYNFNAYLALQFGKRW